MNKEIEEMTSVLCDLNCSNKCQHKTDGVLCQRCSAEALYNAGYRKIDQTHKQLQEEIVQISVAKDLSTLLLAEAEYFCDSEGHIESDKFAEVFIKNGYRNTIWHKVADGDLPKKEERVLCYTRYNDYTTGCFTHTKSQGDIWDLDNDMRYREPQWVIAWTELPRYEGEEQ